MKTNQPDFNCQLLRKERLKQRLTVKKLAELVELNVSTIASYENGVRKPSVRRWEALKEALGIGDTWIFPPKEKIPEPVRFSFEAGCSYHIVDSGMKGYNNGMISPPTGDLCVFRYKGKEGIHHVFTEARGGWTRTYTDAQLIGKIIEETKG